jgi:hypothetical protein
MPRKQASEELTASLFRIEEYAKKAGFGGTYCLPLQNRRIYQVSRLRKNLLPPSSESKNMPSKKASEELTASHFRIEEYAK